VQDIGWPFAPVQSQQHPGSVGYALNHLPFGGDILEIKAILAGQGVSVGAASFHHNCPPANTISR
jgi:hypothetical protein